MLYRPDAFLQWCRKRYGPVFTVQMGPLGNAVYLTEPDHVRALFRAGTDVARAGEANRPFLEPVLGTTSVLVTDDAPHRRQRRLLMPAFHGESITALAETMARIAADEIETWPVGRPFPSRPRFQAITLEVILRTVIGAEDDASLAELREALPPLVEFKLLDLLQFLVPRLRGYWPWKKFRAIEARADAALLAEIERGRRDPGLDHRTDVLAMLLRARDEDGVAMTTEELRDQLVTVLLAGHETTATGLAWAVERLIRHPTVLERAQEAAIADDNDYLDALVAETLRVRPVVPDISRRLTQDWTIAGYDLPAGTMVDPAIPVIQHCGQHYTDPKTFRPERFLGHSPDPLAWMPFGGGNRRCIGAAFATTEMRIVLKELLTRVELATTDAPGETPRARHVTMIPRHQGVVTVTGRLRAHGTGRKGPWLRRDKYRLPSAT
jgi:cytochrome P450